MNGENYSNGYLSECIEVFLSNCFFHFLDSSGDNVLDSVLEEEKKRKDDQRNFEVKCLELCCTVLDYDDSVMTKCCDTKN